MDKVLDDNALVRRTLDGDLNAFESLVIKYERRILQFVNNVLHDRAESEDVTQEAFLQAFRCLDSYRFEAAFSTWLHRIALNGALTCHKLAGRRPLSMNDDALYSDRFDMVADASERSDPAAIVEFRQLLAAIDRQIAILPTPFARVVVMTVCDDFSTADIALFDGIAPGTVRSRLYRAREALADYLNRTGLTDGVRPH